MSYLAFDKEQLVNLEYAFERELIRSNRAGSYASTTIVGCNTRKYHGLLVCPLQEMDGEHHVLLSTLDASVIQHEKEFNLGIHKYPGDNYQPKGHKYVREFDATKGSFVRYRVGGVVLSREMLLVSEAEQVLVKYTLLDAHSRTIIRLKPFLAFRNYHSLSKSNLYARTRYAEVRNGIMSRLYDGYPGLYMQLSRASEFVAFPDWYYQVEYLEEMQRGYPYQEDLFVPGYFEFPIRKGESVVFSASTAEVAPGGLKRRFTQEYNLRIPKDGYRNCLLNAAQQFIIRRNRTTEIKAGFPWYGTWSRDTFLALPGLTMATGDLGTAREVFRTMLAHMQGGFFPNLLHEKKTLYHAADIPLWFIWSLQQYAGYDPGAHIWKLYGAAVRSVLEAFRSGSAGNGIRMRENGLIHAAAGGKALTWMDAVVGGEPVTRRAGYAVEINALWYNAVRQAILWASDSDRRFVQEWEHLPRLTGDSFSQMFWSEERGYLADYSDDGYRDFSVRPNQLIAASLDHSPLTHEMKKAVLDVVESELLTPRGIRSLSPKNEAYEGVCTGNQDERDRSYHQGTAWPWLLEHFARAYADVHKKSGQALIRRLSEEFEPHLAVRGIGSVSEVFDGNPPHDPRGAVSQATSVAALLRLGELIDGFA